MAALRSIDGSEASVPNLAKHWHNTIQELRALEKYIFAYWCSYKLYKQQQHTVGPTLATQLQASAFATLDWKWTTKSRQHDSMQQLIHKVGKSGDKETIDFSPVFPDNGTLDELCAQHGLQHDGGYFYVAGPGYPHDISCVHYAMMSAIKANNMWSLTDVCAKLYTVQGKLSYSHPPSTYDQFSNSDGTTTLNTYVVPVRETSTGQIDDDLCVERLISDLTGTTCIHRIDQIMGHREIEISDPDSSSTTLAQIYAVRWLNYPQHDSWHHLEDLDHVAVDEYHRSQGVAA